MADEDDIILADLDDEELVKQMFDDLYDGLKEEIEEGVNILLGRGWMPYRCLTEALVEGMRIVGDRLSRRHPVRAGSSAGRQRHEGGMLILQAACWLKPGAPRMGKMVIGTVKGDIHDIGKNLVGMMMEGAGFEVVIYRHQQSRSRITWSAGRAQADYPGHVGSADHHDALHEGRDRHDEGNGHARRLHQCWSVARR